MDTREIRVSIEQEPELYDVLMRATMEHREYEGGYVMCYSESNEYGQMIARFTLRDKNRPSSV